MNISKKRFPFLKIKKWEYVDTTFIYNLPKSKRGDWMNTWFPGVISKDEVGRYYVNELWTLKKVDFITSRHLYDRKYNPISLNIYCPVGAKFTTNEKKEVLYNFKAQIHSIDDSSYGMWWNGLTIAEIDKIKLTLMKWVDLQDEVNGQKWFDLGRELNAVDFDTN